ncbi:hypothetical protein IFM61606_04437 [Aspergillus udagawae]|nr:hypothetical protein IFM61606_04437 [Aspergillus udagawae]
MLGSIKNGLKLFCVLDPRQQRQQLVDWSFVRASRTSSSCGYAASGVGNRGIDQPQSGHTFVIKTQKDYSASSRIKVIKFVCANWFSFGLCGTDFRNNFCCGYGLIVLVIIRNGHGLVVGIWEYFVRPRRWPSTLDISGAETQD